MRNACVIGCGAIGPVHMKALRTCADARLGGVCDVVPERAEKYARLYGVKAFSSFGEVLSDPEIDAVHICTPHYLHQDMAAEALASGRDVVLEKPAAMDADEFELLRSAVERSENKLCMMLQSRTNYCIETLKKIMDEDHSLGKLVGLTGFMTWDRDDAYYASEPWRGKWETEGGGLLINQAVHLIDLLSYLGGGISGLKANISTKLLHVEVEDTADALLFFKNGARGCFYAANTYPTGTPFQVEVCFEHVRFRYADNTLYEIRKKQPVKIIAADDMTAPGKALWGNGHKYVIDDFYAALANGTDDYISIRDVENSSRALFAMYESGKRGGVLIEI